MAQYAMTDQVRTSVFPNGVRKVTPGVLYVGGVGVGGLNKGLGDSTRVDNPSPVSYEVFEEVAEIQGQDERWTTSITNRIMVGEESPFAAITRRPRKFAMHMRVGTCKRVPQDMQDFDQLEILTDVRITSYSTSDYSVIASDAREQVTETAEISAKNRWTIYPLQYSFRNAPSEATSSPLGVVIAPAECGTGEADVIAVLTAIGVHVCRGNGTTTVVNVGTSAGGGGIVYLGGKLAAGYDAKGLKIVNVSDRAVSSSDITMTDVGVGDVDAIAANRLFGVLGTALKIVRFNAAFNDFDAVDITTLAGSATEVNALSVSPEGVCVAVLDGSIVLKSNGGLLWSAVTNLTSGDGASVTALSADCWLVGTDTGVVYMTDNAGVTWTASYTHGSSTPITGLAATADDNVVYMTVGGSIYRSVDGGVSFEVEPHRTDAVFPTVTSFHGISVCPENPNLIAAACKVTTTGKLLLGSI